MQHGCCRLLTFCAAIFLTNGLLLCRADAPEKSAESESASRAERKPEPERERERPEPERERPEWKISFEEGVGLSTADDRFTMRIRLMQQLDAKYFNPNDQDPARSGLYLPRIRLYFEGHATRSFQYEVSLQRSVEGTFDILDANINYSPCDEVQFKFGRMIVPYSFDWYDHLEQFFIAPERGLFPLNFGLSRQAGAMVWGRLDDGVVQYAVGGFSGQTFGLADSNTTQDAVAYLNVRPWRHDTDRPLLRNLNLGGSGAFGQQRFPVRPLPLRTALQSSENDEAGQAASPVFLELEDDVLAHGPRLQGALHLAWYFRHLSLEAEYQVGRFQTERVGLPVRLPVNGYNVALGYFITGEEIEKRTVVRPLRPFDPRCGLYGSGAIELFARYSRLHIGDEVFSAGLANPDDWTNRAAILDVGWNWYPNEYVKVYCDWQHAMFGSPVLINRQKGTRSRSNDVLWLRAQLSF